MSMHPRPGERTPTTRRKRGQVLVIVAVMGLGLLVIAGLAIDGGIEQGRYRQAQNAADAGALAAARLAFNTLVAGGQPATSDLQNAADAEVRHNGGSPGTAYHEPNAVLALLGVTDAEAAGPGGSAVPDLNWQLQPCSNPSAEAQFVDVSSSNPPGPTVAGHVGDANLTGTAAGTGCVVTSSGQVKAAGFTSPPGPSGSVNCWNSSSSSSVQIACPDAGNLPVLAASVAPTAVSVSASLNQGTTQSGVTNGDPWTYANAGVTTLTGQVGAVTFNATSATSTATLTAVAGGYIDDAETVMIGAGGTVVTPSGNVQWTLTNASVQVRSQNGTNTITLKCGAGSSVTVLGTTVSLNPDCSAVGPFPPLLNTTVQTRVVSQSCSESPPVGYTCNTSACVLKVTVSTPGTSLCIGEATTPSMGVYQPASPSGGGGGGCGGGGPTVASISPKTGPTTGGTVVLINGSGFSAASSVHFGNGSAAFSIDSPSQITATSPPGNPGTVDVTVTALGTASCATGADRYTYGSGGGDTGGPCCTGQPPSSSTQGWTETANVQSPTFLLGLLGWLKTHPTATATARIYGVGDESDSAFAAAPYAMPDMATRQDPPGGFEKLTVGHQYYLWGTSMSTYSPVALFGTTWQGKVDASSGHAVGSTLTADTGVAGGPAYYPGGGSYYVLPVVTQTGVINYYAEFLQVAGSPHLGLLINSVPASGGYVVEATPGGGWQSDDPGAVVIRLTQ